MVRGHIVVECGIDELDGGETCIALKHADVEM
jgi:hypothetical protein